MVGGVAGHLAEDLLETALVARSFLQLHEGWLEASFGPLALRPTSTDADVRLHVDHTLGRISGASLGCALLGATALVHAA